VLIMNSSTLPTPAGTPVKPRTPQSASKNISTTSSPERKIKKTVEEGDELAVDTKKSIAESRVEETTVESAKEPIVGSEPISQDSMLSQAQPMALPKDQAPDVSQSSGSTRTTTPTPNRESGQKGKSRPGKKIRQQKGRKSPKFEIDNTPDIAEPSLVIAEGSETTTMSREASASDFSSRKPSMTSTSISSNSDVTQADIIEYGQSNHDEAAIHEESTVGSKGEADGIDPNITTQSPNTENLVALPRIESSLSFSSKLIQKATELSKDSTQANADDCFSTSNTVATKQRSGRTKNENQDETGNAKIESTSTVSNDSSRKSDTKSTKSKKRNKKGRETRSVSSPELPKEDEPSFTGILTDDTHFPALAPPRSPPSNLADGKAPRVPAIPFNFRKRVDQLVTPVLPLPTQQPGPANQKAANRLS